MKKNTMITTSTMSLSPIMVKKLVIFPIVIKKHTSTI
jgi:hypothetical protein